jgi:hypothetical protein
LLAVIEIQIQVYFGKQQREILEVFHVEYNSFQLIALFRDGIPVLHNIQIVTAHVVLADKIRLKQIVLKRMEKPGLTILVYALVPVFTQAFFQSIDVAAVEKAHHPMVEN